MNDRRERSRKGSLFLVVFCGFFVVLSVLAGFASYRSIRLGAESVHWPTTPGRVTLSENRRSSQNLAEVRYAYRVDGKAYQSTRIAFVPAPFRGPTHERYALDQSVVVAYKENEPALAILEPGAPLLGILNKLLVSLIFLTIGLAGTIYGLRGMSDR